ncbi:hypothetical protein BY996DRAFT_6419710 [Phakopsora pachyrhizi]|nr:hypothetical protein BY996DRAFT_6419710 [Phakopsora pachyrhizi]
MTSVVGLDVWNFASKIGLVLNWGINIIFNELYCLKALREEEEEEEEKLHQLPPTQMPQSSRKFKVEEETSEILKTLGKKKSKPSNSSSRINQDWEEIDDGNEMVMAEDDGYEKRVRNKQLKTSKASSKLRLPSGPQDFMNHTSPDKTQGSESHQPVLTGSSNKSS